jgi:hypothetical protein
VDVVEGHGGSGVWVLGYREEIGRRPQWGGGKMGRLAPHRWVRVALQRRYTWGECELVGGVGGGGLGYDVWALADLRVLFSLLASGRLSPGLCLRKSVSAGWRWRLRG